ncbi:MAG: hypothetical protein AAGF71_09760 [Pseudomonadota bacterium]
MWKKLKDMVGRLLCHRAAYIMLHLTYVGALLGIEKGPVSAAAALCYLVLSLRAH